MKKIVAYGIALFSCALNMCQAAVPGFYVGAGGGYGVLRTPNQRVFVVTGPGSTNTKQRGGLSGRAFLGYNMTRFIGLEGGFGRYATSRYTASMEGLGNASLRYYAYEADGVVKFYLPFGCSGFNVYALGGAGVYLGQQKFANNNGLVLINGFMIPTRSVESLKRTRPIYGGGVSMDWGCHVTTNVEFTQLQRLGTFSEEQAPTPFANLYTFNVAYHLG